MVSRNSVLVLIFAAACCAGSVYAAGDDGSTPPGGAPAHGKRGHKNMAQFILNHATDLSLTADQTTALTALAKPADGAADAKTDPGEMKTKVEAILTADQLTKLKELMKSMKGGDKGGEKTPDGDEKK